MLTFLFTVPTHMLVFLLQASWLHLHCLAELPMFAPIPIPEFSKKSNLLNPAADATCFDYTRGTDLWSAFKGRLKYYEKANSI